MQQHTGRVEHRAKRCLGPDPVDELDPQRVQRRWPLGGEALPGRFDHGTGGIVQHGGRCQADEPLGEGIHLGGSRRVVIGVIGRG